MESSTHPRQGKRKGKWPFTKRGEQIFGIAGMWRERDLNFCVAERSTEIARLHLDRVDVQIGDVNVART